MVSTAITVSGVTCRPDNEYTPAVTSRSWITAMMAAAAIFHSKRMLM